MLKQTPEGILIKVKIVPNSSKNEIIMEEEFIKIKVTAQPIENKANKALIEFLSKQFKLPKSNIEIVRGGNSKEKTIFLRMDIAGKIGKLFPDMLNEQNDELGKIDKII